MFYPIIFHMVIMTYECIFIYIYIYIYMQLLNEHLQVEKIFEL